MKSVYLIIIFPILLFSQAKKNYTFGEISKEELALNHYVKDSTANAVVLYEEGSNYFKVVNGYVRLITKNYFKIKIFNKKAFDIANVNIPLYKGTDSEEKISDLKAITHNSTSKTYLEKKHIYNEKINEHWNQVTFTFPNIKENCILEYEYTTTSPFFFNLTGWEFQSNIPKIKSLFTAKIPGNYKYNRKLIGALNLDTNDVTLERKCFYIPQSSNSADCEVLKYGMKNVPAFVEEDYMLSKKNYISKIKFELSEYMSFYGEKYRYSKSWKDVDKEFKHDKNIGRQTNKNSFFRNKIPEAILNIQDELEKAKKTYQFIQNHYTWNKNYGVFKNSKVKKAFDNKLGNASEINLSLVNALKSANLDSNFILVSTRNNGLPTTEYPVISDFNYLIASVNINGKSYFLDATDKNLTFGMLPIKCLNYIGRVMDFNNGSYWVDIKPTKKNSNTIVSKIIINPEGEITGHIKNTTTGYYALNKAYKINNSTKKEYLNNLKNDKNNLEITTSTSQINIQKRNTLTEEFDFVFDEQDHDYIIIHPFLIESLDENPFTLNNRNYPVDFAYQGKQIYLTSIEIPTNFEVIESIKNQKYQLPNNAGSINLIHQQMAGKINISLRFSLNSYHFEPTSYNDLKVFFSKLVTIQKSNPIIFRKKEMLN